MSLVRREAIAPISSRAPQYSATAMIFQIASASMTISFVCVRGSVYGLTPAAPNSDDAPMTIWIIRHGKTQRDSHSGLDADRVLKPRGHRQSAYLGAEFVSRDDAPDQLIASPLVRAQETAHGIAGVTMQEVETHGALESGRGPAGILALIEEAGADASIGLVGHNPELSQVVCALGGSGVVEGDWVRTGQAIAMEFDSGAWSVIDVLRLDD